MKIGIIGANGEVGLGLTYWLKNNPRYHVVPIVRSRHTFSDPLTRICDLRNPSQINAALKGLDIIINLAGRIEGRDYEDFYIDNYICSVNLYKACRSNKVKHLIHFSSILTCTHPNSSYGKTKLLSDQYFIKQLSEGLPVLIIRPSWIITTSPKSLLHKFSSLIKVFPVLPVPKTGLFQPIFETTLYHFLQDFIDNRRSYPKHKIIYGVGKDKMTLKNFFQKLAVTLEKHRILLEFPLSLLIEAVKLKNSILPGAYVDLEKIRIQGDDRIHVETCPELEQHIKPIEEDLKKFFSNGGTSNQLNKYEYNPGSTS